MGIFANPNRIYLLCLYLHFSLSTVKKCFNQEQFPLIFDLESSDFTFNSMDYNEIDYVMVFGGEANNMPYVGVFYDKSPIHRISWIFNY